MKVKNIFFLMIFTVLGSCSTDRNKSIDDSNLDKLFPNESVFLKGIELKLNSDSLGKTFAFQVIDTLLVINSPTRDYLFKVVDLKNELIVGDYGKKGDGPGELGFPSFIQRIPGEKEKITIFHKNKFIFYEIGAAQFLKSTENKPQKILSTVDFNVQQIARINDRYIAVGIYSKRFATIDEKGDTMSTFADYPFQGDYENIAFQSLAMAFQGKFGVKPEGNLAVFAVSNSANFDIIDLSDLMKPKLVRAIHSWKPSFADASSKNSIATVVRSDNRFGYLDVTVSNQFIYLLLSGRTLERDGNDALEANTVLVFDWDGHPIKSYTLDSDTRVIAVDEGDEFLYAFADEEDPLIIKYALLEK